MTQYNNLLIEDIFLSGFVEREGEISVFKPMFWWCFLKLDNGKIIEISSNDGNVKLVETPKINCNFDLEEEDIFCIMSHSPIENYGRIIDMRYLFDETGNLVTLKIETSSHRIQINATTSFEGLDISIIR